MWGDAYYGKSIFIESFKSLVLQDQVLIKKKKKKLRGMDKEELPGFHIQDPNE